jgi:hypothetical protein
VRTVLVDGEVVLDERRHTWIDRDALVTELGDVARRQAADAHWRDMGDIAERLARAFGTYPKRVFSPLPR